MVGLECEAESRLRSLASLGILAWIDRARWCTLRLTVELKAKSQGRGLRAGAASDYDHRFDAAPPCNRLRRRARSNLVGSARLELTSDRSFDPSIG